MTYEEIFERTKDRLTKATLRDISEQIAVQFNIVGEGHGSFYAKIADGKIDVQPYDYIDNDAYIIASAEELLYALENKAGDTLQLYGSLDKTAILRDMLLSIPKARKKNLKQ